MESVFYVRIAVFAFFIIAALFALITAQSRKKLIKAHAGGMQNALGGESHISYSKVLEKIVDIESKKALSLKKYFPIEVEGNCLSDIGIEDGDILVVEKIKVDNLKEKLNPFDVILLKVTNEDEGGKEIHKIRIVEKVLDNNEIQTFYFEEKDGISYKKFSAKNHNCAQVQGVILYKQAV